MSEEIPDAKREIRRAKVFYLHLMGCNKTEIAANLRMSESTVDRDLEAVQENVDKTPIDYNQIRNEALNSLRLTKKMLLDTFEESENKPWTKAKILSIIKDIDVKVLEGFAQPMMTTRMADIQAIKTEAKMVVSFLAKTHPELLEEFKMFLKSVKTDVKEEVVSIQSGLQQQ
jgi:transposase